MKETREVGIIGLGKFGLQLGTTLASLGHKAIGLDASPARVHVVSVGEVLDASILIVLNLQELGAKNIIVKSASPSHKKVMQRIGVGRIIQPEIDVATQLAYSLDNPGMLDILPIGRGVVLQEATVVKWAGKTLKELNLRDVSGVLVAAVMEAGKSDYLFVPDPGRPFSAGDKLLMIGYQDVIAGVIGKT